MARKPDGTDDDDPREARTPEALLSSETWVRRLEEARAARARVLASRGKASPARAPEPAAAAEPPTPPAAHEEQDIGPDRTAGAGPVSLAARLEQARAERGAALQARGPQDPGKADDAAQRLQSLMSGKSPAPDREEREPETAPPAARRAGVGRAFLGAALVGALAVMAFGLLRDEGDLTRLWEDAGNALGVGTPDVAPEIDIAAAPPALEGGSDPATGEAPTPPAPSPPDPATRQTAPPLPAAPSAAAPGADLSPARAPARPRVATTDPVPKGASQPARTADPVVAARPTDPRPGLQAPGRAAPAVSGTGPARVSSVPGAAIRVTPAPTAPAGGGLEDSATAGSVLPTPAGTGPDLPASPPARPDQGSLAEETFARATAPWPEGRARIAAASTAAGRAALTDKELVFVVATEAAAPPAAYEKLGARAVRVRATPFAPDATAVHYFHPEDLAAARSLAEDLDGKLIDLTGFRPAPPAGLIEVYTAPGQDP